MNVFRKIGNMLKAVKNWYTSRKVRRARRAAGKVVDTTAAGAGFVLRMGVKVVITALLVFITTGMVLACIFAVYVKTCMTDLDLTPEELSSAMSSTVWAVDQNTGEKTELEVLHATENRIWVEYDQIPIHMEHACVAIEDERFYTHKGVDWWRTLGAFGNMFLSMQDTFGGSTLTQQLIKNLTGKDQVTVQRKLLEIFQALEFEKKYTKQEIVGWYLNEIYLGEGCYGVGAAAREYFNKEVWQLDLAECAALIGITNNPSLYDPYIGPESRARNKARQELILTQMYKQGYITKEECDQAKAETLVFKRADGEDYEIPIHSYYVDSLIWELSADLAEAKGITKRQAEMLIYNGGYNIYCCMDTRIQRVVDEIYQNTSNLPASYYNPSGQKLSSAIVVMEPYTGEILALAGDTGVKTGSLVENYATEYVRPPGSSFKPVAVYAPALDMGLITQKTTVNDSPGVKLHGTSWYPRNSGGGNSGWVTIRQGLARSLNTVAAQVLDRIGLQASWNYLTNRFGFKNLVRDHVDENTGSVVTDYGYAALALGQLNYGITPKEMAQAYTAFVNDGVMSFGRTYSYVEDSNGTVVLNNPARQQVAVKANTAWNIDDMLQNAVQNGTGTMAWFGTTAIAGKTGTTSNDCDRYFVGFSRYYVAAVWTGYRHPSQMYFWSNPAAQIWRSVMVRIHDGLSWWGFKTPSIGKGGGLWDKATHSGGGGGGETSTEQEAPPPVTAPPAATDEPIATDAPPVNTPDGGGSTTPGGQNTPPVTNPTTPPDNPTTPPDNPTTPPDNPTTPPDNPTTPPETHTDPPETHTDPPKQPDPAPTENVEPPSGDGG